MTPLLEVKKLFHILPNQKTILSDVNLSIEQGAFVVLAGSNGSGKTMLMRHLNGLLRPTSGEVLLEGRSIQDNLPAARRRVGLVFQDADAQILGQTVASDIAFGPENLRLNREEINLRVERSLKQTGLEGFQNRRPHTLSGGEKKRLAVAGILSMNPDLLVLDEPFIGLDWPGCGAILSILDELAGMGKTILVITHDLEKVAAHADALVLMQSGRIQAQGLPEKMIELVEQYGIRRPTVPLNQMSWLRRI